MLANVTSAWWTDTHGESFLTSDDALAFVVQSGSDKCCLHGDTFAEDAVSFLHALSMYWETRT